MGKFQTIWTARCREMSVKMSLLLLIGTATVSAFGQPCPTSGVTLNVTNADFAAGRVCGGPSNGGCTTFNFTFPTASAACATTLTFTPSQGCGGGGGNLDVYNNVGGVCTPVPVSGGGVVTITNITTPNYTIVVCRPGNGPASLEGLSATGCCTPAVTCPTLAPAAVSCAADLPAAATTAADFLALGGGAAITDCGQPVDIVSEDVYSSALACANRNLMRTYTITIGTFSRTCTITYPILASVTTISGCPNPVTVSCVSEVPPVSTAVTATDNCGGTATITASDVESGRTCANRYTITRTYTATDICGNTTTCSQVIRVQDETGPVLTGTATLPNIPCGATLPDATEAVYTATDACTGAVTVRVNAWVLDPTSTVCTGSRYQRIWTATDVCGNESTREQTIQMNLPTLPTMTAPANITGICSALPAATRIEFTNSTTGACALTGLSALSTYSQVPACEGTVIETWTMPASAATCNRALVPVSRTITCTSGLSCATTKIKDANCDGSNGSATVTLTGGVAATYRWDNDETTATATQLNQGLHQVTVTSTAGCVTICNVRIGNTTNLECSVVQNGPASCRGANGSATVTATGGAGTIRFAWDNGETTATATALTAGTHIVEVISGNCHKACSVVIRTTGENLKMGACSKTDATCGGKNGSVAAGVITGQAGTLYFTWRNAANEIVGKTERVTDLKPGVYTLTLKDACAEVTCKVTVGQSGKDCEDKADHFYPDATTCCTYTNGSSKPIRHLSYKAKAHDRITEITPKTFYYYAKIVAPSSNFTVNLVQTKNVVDFKFLGLNKDYIQLWDAHCSKSVKGVLTTDGQGKVSIQNAKVGSTYILAVRLDTKGLLNTACKQDLPDVTYTFASYINNELVPNSKGSIQLKPNCEAAHLDAGKCSKKAPEAGDEVESSVNNTLWVQPNPAQSVVNVLFESVAAAESVISVANINGAIVQTLNYEAQQGKNNVSLEIESLPAGTYFVTVQTAHQFMTKQLVVLR
jgi:hypothetical protein